MSTPLLTSLRLRDYLLLAAYALLVCGFALWFNRTFSTHETVGCVNIREMLAGGDWIIPHYGGRPWLERPPLPFWLTMPFVSLLGDQPLAYRLPPLLVALFCTFLVAWMTSLWYGRAVGLLAGVILVTLREFTLYSVAPECDMFLCGIVTAALALFAYLEFRRRPAQHEPLFVGLRPWAVLSFFAVLGMANLVKGLFFGNLMILVPVAAFLLLGNQPWAHVRRYLWLPGWLAFAVVGSAWALAAYLRHPDIVELWKSDYAGRLNQGYMREPIWYYLAHLPWILFPWSILAVVGLVVTWPRVLGQGRTPERFLWCWALAPVVFFSIPQGKHHHYLLHVVAPWAVLAALGTLRVWRWLPGLNWMQTPWPTLATVVLPGEAALLAAGNRFGPPWLWPAALVVWPCLVLAGWWIASRRDLRVAMIGLFALLVPAHWFGHAVVPLVADRYRDDRAFLERIRQELPAGAPLLVLDDYGPLDASWPLFYLDGRGRLLHNPTFLRQDRGDGREVYLIARRFRAPSLLEYGTSQLLFETRSSRDERQGAQMRYGLYRVRLHEGVACYQDPVYISPMQATGRAPGPELPALPRPVARR